MITLSRQATLAAKRIHGAEESGITLDELLAAFAPIGPRLWRKLEGTGLAYISPLDRQLYLTDAGRRAINS